MDGSHPMGAAFVRQYREYCRQFDEIVADLFKGPQLDLLSKQFMAQHQEFLDQHAWTAFTDTGADTGTDTDPRNGNSDSLIDQDLAIVTGGECQVDALAVLASEHDLAEQRAMVDQIIERADANLIIGDIYRRACQATYLRVTYNKSRLKQEDDRLEAVTFSRLAIRYKPDNFLVCYWFMISLGWYLDTLTSPKERTLVSRVFQQVAIRNTKLNPRDALPHNLLGRYYYEIAQLTWIEKKLVKSLLGVKLEGSYQDAEREFMLAHELKGNWLPTGLWLARVLVAQHRPLDEIKQWIDFGLSLEAREPTSEIEREELLELRSKLKITN